MVLADAVTELKTMPHILSTQMVGAEVWARGLLVLVAQGMVNQSVMHESPTTEPSWDAEPPVTLNDMAIVFTDTTKRSNILEEKPN